jgi:hypothetical protein
MPTSIGLYVLGTQLQRNGNTHKTPIISIIIVYKQMHFNINYNVHILLGSLLHVSAILRELYVLG